MGNCKSTQPEQHILVEEEDFPYQPHSGGRRLLRLRKTPTDAEDELGDERIQLKVDTASSFIKNGGQHRTIPSYEEDDDDTLIFEAVKADDISPTSGLTLQTAPLTPEEESLFSFPQQESTKSITSTPSIVSSPSSKGVDDSFGADQPPSPSPQKDKTSLIDSPVFWRTSSSQSVASSTTLSASVLSGTSEMTSTSTQSHSSHARPSQALQKRLQKARYVQMVASSPTPKISESSSSGNTSYASSSFLDDASIRSNLFATRQRSRDSDYSNFSASTKYSLHGNNKNKTRIGNGTANILDDRNHPSKKHARHSNNEFESLLNKHGMVWTEFQAGSPALAVAMNGFGEEASAVMLAVGTEKGQLLMTELLDFGPSNMGQPLQPVWQKEGRIRAIDFLPGDDKCVACAGDDGVCTLLGLEGWTSSARELQGDEEGSSVEDGQVHVLAEIRQKDRIYACRFSPDGQYLAIGGYDHSVVIFDVTSLTAPMMVSEIPVNALVSTLSWSPDSFFLAIGGSDKTCTVVENTGVDSFQVFGEIRRSAAIHALQWHPSSCNPKKYDLAIGANNVALFDKDTLTTQHEIHIEAPVLDEEALVPISSQASFCSNTSFSSGATPVTRIQDMSWSPENGKYLVTCDSHNRIKILETTSFSTIHETMLDSTAHCIAWGHHMGSTDGQYLCIGAQDGKVLVMKTASNGHSLDDDLTSETDASSCLGSSIEWTLKDHTFLDADDASKDEMSTNAE